MEPGAQLRWLGEDRRLQKFSLRNASAPYLIGRSPGLSVQLPDLSVSREHAQISFADGRWVLKDTHSTAGTFVLRGGSRINASAELVLRDGDRIIIASTELRFVDPDYGHADATPRVEGTVPLGPTVALTPTEKRVVSELRANRVAGIDVPPSNDELARRLFITVDAVRLHLKNLYGKFDIQGTNTQKKAKLIDAIEHSVIV